MSEQWKVEKLQGGNIVIESGIERICVIPRDLDNLEQRAALIAAAPQMLALIKECNDYLTPSGDVRQINEICTTSQLHKRMQALIASLP